MSLSAERRMLLRLECRLWRACCSGEVRLPLMERGFRKLGWDIMERIWKIYSSKGWNMEALEVLTGW